MEDTIMLENNQVLCNPKLHTPSQVSSNANLRRSSRSRNSVNYSEIEKAPVLVCSRDVKHNSNSGIKEASVSMCVLNAKHNDNGGIKEASALVEHPSFVKPLLKAHAKHGFLLTIPTSFSKRHLPEEDTMMMLETDRGEEYETKYLPKHSSLSQGWRKYAIDQKLEIGDAVLFQLVEPTRFKVHIIRKGSSTVNLPTTTLNVHRKPTQIVPGAIKSIISNTVNIAITLTTSTLSSFLCNFSQWNKSLKYYEALGMNVAFLRTRVQCLRNLAVSSKGAVNRSRYMEACRECPRAECEVKKLEIGVDKLRKISLLLEAEVKTFESRSCYKKYFEACSRLVQVEQQIRENEILLAEFVRFFKHYHDIIEKLKMKVNKHDCQFQEAVSAPW